MKKIIYNIKLWISPALIPGVWSTLPIEEKYDELIKLAIIASGLIGIVIGGSVGVVITYMFIK